MEISRLLSLVLVLRCRFLHADTTNVGSNVDSISISTWNQGDIERKGESSSSSSSSSSNLRLQRSVHHGLYRHFHDQAQRARSVDAHQHKMNGATTTQKLNRVINPHHQNDATDTHHHKQNDFTNPHHHNQNDATDNHHHKQNDATDPHHHKQNDVTNPHHPKHNNVTNPHHHKQNDVPDPHLHKQNDATGPHHHKQNDVTNPHHHKQKEVTDPHHHKQIDATDPHHHRLRNDPIHRRHRYHRQQIQNENESFKKEMDDSVRKTAGSDIFHKFIFSREENQVKSSSSKANDDFTQSNMMTAATTVATISSATNTSTTVTPRARFQIVTGSPTSFNTDAVTFSMINITNNSNSSSEVRDPVTEETDIIQPVSELKQQQQKQQQLPNLGSINATVDASERRTSESPEAAASIVKDVTHCFRKKLKVFKKKLTKSWRNLWKFLEKEMVYLKKSL